MLTVLTVLLFSVVVEPKKITCWVPPASTGPLITIKEITIHNLVVS